MRAHCLSLGSPKSRSCEKYWTMGCLVSHHRKLEGWIGQRTKEKEESRMGALMSRLPLWIAGVQLHWGSPEKLGRTYPRTNSPEGREVGAVVF